MSSEQPNRPPPSQQQQEIARLKEENERLRRENESLNKKIAQMNSTAAPPPPAEPANSSSNAAMHREIALRRAALHDDEVASNQNELAVLRKRCEQYEEALEKSAANLNEMKTLYAELVRLIPSQPPAPAK